MDQAAKLRELSKNALISKYEETTGKESSPAHVIAITSGKGGVGKSTFTVNLALVLASFNKRVLIIDADLGMANVDVMMGCTANYSLLNIINGTHSLEEVLVTGPKNVKILSGGSGIRSLTKLSTIELQRVINQIVQYEKNTDFVLFDTGAGMGENVMSFLLAAEDIILVTTPEPTALTDAYSILKAYLGNKGKAPLRLVINKAGNEKESAVITNKLTKVAARFLNIQLEQLGYIIEDTAVSKSIKVQSPLVIESPNSPAAKCIANIGHKLVFGSEKIEKTGISGFLKKFLSNNIYKKF